MAPDAYHNFDRLNHNENLDLDFRISIFDVGSPVTIIAPHGGKIEPQTSYIAGRIAEDKFNCYCFEGIKAADNRTLHLTSHKFDEPRALELLARSRIVLAVHACTDHQPLVYPGGRDEELITVIAAALTAAGICVAKRDARYQGLHPDNICNRGASGKGAQLEISRGLRDDRDSVDLMCNAIHKVLINELKRL